MMRYLFTLVSPSVRKSFQGKIKENRIFPARGVGRGHPFALLIQEGNIRQSNGKGRGRMYLVLDIVDYVPGWSEVLQMVITWVLSHKWHRQTHPTPLSIKHCFVFFLVFFVFLIFSHTNGTTRLISCCCSRILYFFLSKICFDFNFPCEHSQI